MKIYIKFFTLIFLKSLLYVISIMFSLIFILNLLTELEFFKEIEGSISKIIDGEFKNDKKIGKLAETSISLKNSNSVKRFRINIKLNITEITYSKDFKKISVKNFIYIFIF